MTNAKIGWYGYDDDGRQWELPTSNIVVRFVCAILTVFASLIWFALVYVFLALVFTCWLWIPGLILGALYLTVHYPWSVLPFWLIVGFAAAAWIMYVAEDDEP